MMPTRTLTPGGQVCSSNNDVSASTSSCSLDDSLTSLAWLHNLNIMKMTMPTPPASPQTTALTQQQQQQQEEDPGVHESCCVTDSEQVVVDNNNNNNSRVKPPYSYATLICMAMRATPTNKITLSGIYKWIIDNFVYYKYADQSWQNSIRHNLSLNKYFEKVPRAKDEPGKGGFWRINPQYQNHLEQGVFRKRRTASPSRVSCQRASSSEEMLQTTVGDEDEFLAAVKRFKSEEVEEETTSDCGKFEISRDWRLGVSWPRQLLDDALNLSWSSVLNGASGTGEVEAGMFQCDHHQLTDGRLLPAVSSPLSPPPSDIESDTAVEELLHTYFADSAGSQLLDLTVRGTTLPPVSTVLATHNNSQQQQQQQQLRYNGGSLFGDVLLHDQDLDLPPMSPWSRDLDDVVSSYCTADIDSLFI